MNKNLFNKISATVSILGLFLLTTPMNIIAAQQTSFKDVMSTQAKNVTATHTLTWTPVSTFAAGDTIAIDFVNADFTATAAASWQTSDFAFTDNVRTATAPVAVGASPACSSGATNYTVAIDVTNVTFTLTACTSWTTSNTAQFTFVIYGTAATGNGTLTNANADTNSSIITLTDTGSNTDSTKGAVVIETNDVVTVTATVNPTLTLAISSASVGLGTLSTSAPATGSHTLAVASNATAGFIVSYNGITLTSGTDTIAAYSASSSSVAGTAGFGINLKANTTPVVGAAVTQTAGTCGIATNYGGVNSFSYVASTSTTVTNVTAPADCTYTVSYVANISSVTPAGSYSAPITWIASGTF